MEKRSLFKRHWKRVTFWFILLCAIYYIIPWSHVIIRSNNWLQFYIYRNYPARNLIALESQVKNSGLQIAEGGRVTYESRHYPILSASRTNPNANKKLCVFSGVHGNEPAGVEASLQLIADLGKNHALYPDLNFLIVPLVNPWGWEHDVRSNGSIDDVNRKFASGSSQESEQIKRLLAREDCDLLVDLHEDRSHHQQLFILTYENAQPAIAEAITAEVAHMGVPLRSSAKNGVYHKREKDFDDDSLPTLSLYARQHGTPFTYIVETPRELDMQERIRLHRLAIDRLAMSLTKMIIPSKSDTVHQ